MDIKIPLPRQSEIPKNESLALESHGFPPHAYKDLRKKYFDEEGLSFALPDEIKKRRQWLLWKLIPDKDNPDNKPRKVPFYVNGSTRTGKHGSDTDRANLATFDEVISLAKTDGFNGIGYAILPDDDIGALDFDHCVKDWELLPSKVEIRELIGNTYTEISPGRDGLRALYRADDMPHGKNHKWGIESFGINGFVTITGYHFQGMEIVPLPNAIKSRIISLLPEKTGSGGGGPGRSANPPGWFKEIIESGVDHGGRHNSLIKYVGRLYRHGLCRVEADIILREVNSRCNPPMPEGELSKLMNSAVRWEERPPGVDEIPAAFVLKCLYANESGDSWLFKALHDDRFVYDHSAERWHEWQGHYWSEDRDKAASAAIDDVVNAYSAEAEKHRAAADKLESNGNEMGDADKRKLKKYKKIISSLKKRISALRGVVRRRNVLTMATYGTGVVAEQWDHAPHLLPCVNGVVDLRTGEIRPGEQEDLIRTVSPIEWTGIDTPCPVWEAFIQSTFDDDGEIIDYVHKLVGYALTGDPVEHILAVFWGSGRNGKGTLLETILEVLGRIGHKTEAELLIQDQIRRTAGNHNSLLLALRNKRVVVASESEKGVKLNSPRTKELSGGDTLSGRAAHSSVQEEFRPSHVIFLMTNELPEVEFDDIAIWARIRLIPFKIRFEDHPTQAGRRKKDKQLRHKIANELPGILAWAVRGAMRYYQEGLSPPKGVVMATTGYQKSMDTVMAFISECCDTGKENIEVERGKLYSAFIEWCRQKKRRGMRNYEFYSEMDKKKQFDSYYNDDLRRHYYTKITLF